MKMERELSPTEFENWLNQFLNFEKNPKKNIFWLETMKFLCEKFGNPQKSYKTIHVAGSKGKGSVSEFIASILEESGTKTGLYTSPHLISFYERIAKAHELFESEIYKSAESEMTLHADFFKTENLPENRAATWFELVTLFAFLTFRAAACDVVVLETGLGGRLDATNIVLPEVSVIMPIELEHTEFLGDTIEKIAYEKAGIIKENIPVICAHQPTEAKEVFEKVAKEKNAPIYFFADFVESIDCKIENQLSCIDIKFSDFEKSVLERPIFERPLHFKSKMLGEVQAMNAAIATFAVKLSFPEISEDTIEKGLENAFLPARFEICKKFGTMIIFDGAHTPNSIKTTCKNFNAISKNFPLARENGMLTGVGVLLFACAKDKKMSEMAEIILKNGFAAIYLTNPGEKQSDLVALKECFEEKLSGTISPDTYLYLPTTFKVIGDENEAFNQALKKAQELNQPLLICGSFYLVAAIKAKYF